MRYIALDIGDVRIGVARSDATGFLASPHEVIDRRKTKAVERIAAICTELQTQHIVVGIPKSLDGTEKRQVEKVRLFLAKLIERLPEANIIEVDERYSTVAADDILTMLTNKGAREKRKVVDKVAAAVILQRYLDSQR